MSKKLVSLFLVVLMIFSMTTAAMAETAPATVTDMHGREITLTEPVTRIVALTPADCEILCAIGCEEMLVGRGEYCDYPASVLELPALATGENLNVEQILALEPQVLIADDMGQVEEQYAQLEANGVKVVVSNTTDIEGVCAAIRMISALTGKAAEGEAVIAKMQATFAYISGLCEKTDKTIYFEVMPLEWGLWTAGDKTFMHELAHICGMENAFADIVDWQPVSAEQVIERDPDYIVLVTGMGETAVDEVLGREGWGDMKAIQAAAVYNADSYALTRPGPRLANAAIGLYEFLYGAEIDETAIPAAPEAE
ncbi:MAG: ABC transporter substrate-binding protein [Clostridia bacterium]|nr:ABC transporter substrate-binding protein [Clostridia bacterium]MBQ4085646.1 ABC transporter substrate-binding protein [Clostridia bacterium]